MTESEAIQNILEAAHALGWSISTLSGDPDDTVPGLILGEITYVEQCIGNHDLVARLKKALGYYADSDIYKPENVSVLRDAGETARNALNG